MASLYLCFAVWTHDIALFGSAVLIAWAVLRYRWRSLALVAPWSILALAYSWEIWNRRVYGLTPHHYLEHFLQNIEHIFQYTPQMVMTQFLGMVTAGGAFWILYAVLGYKAMCRPHSNSKLATAMFIAIGAMANILPVFIGDDSQRMARGIWLPVFILILDAASQRDGPVTFIATKALALLCALQLLIPPVFMVGTHVRPLNTYAEDFMLLVKHNRRPARSARNAAPFLLKNSGRIK